MKLSQYDPQVNRNILQARVQAADNPAAYGSNQSGADTLNRAIGNVAVTLDKAWQQKTYDNVQDATNEYNSRIQSLMYDENAGLKFTMQGKNAEGLQSTYEAEERKIRDEIIRKYNLGNKTAYGLFKKTVDPANNSMLRSIDGLQRVGKEQYANNQMATDEANTQNAILQDPATAVEKISEFAERYVVNRSGLGWDIAATDGGLRKSTDSISQSVLAALTDKEDYENVLNLVPKLREKGVDENILGKYERVARKNETVKTTKKSFSEFLDSTPNWENMTDLELIEAYDKKFPDTKPTAADGTPLGAVGEAIVGKLREAGIDNIDLSSVIAVAAHESARGTSAPGNNFFGYKYTGEGKSQRLLTTEIVDGRPVEVYADFQVYDTPEDSGRAYAQWLLNNCSADELKAVKTPGDLARLMKKHKYYTDDEEKYVNSVENLAKEYTGPDMSDEEWEALKEKKRDAMKTELAARRAEYQKNISQLMVNLKGNAASAEDPKLYTENFAELHPEIRNAPEYKIFMNTLKAAQTKAQTVNTSRKIQACIEGGLIQNMDDLNRAAVEGGITDEQYEKLTQCLNDNISGKSVEILASKEEIGRKVFGNASAISLVAWGNAKIIAKQQAAKFKAETGRDATQEELTQFLEKAVFKGTEVGRGEYSMAELRAKGIASIKEEAGGYYRIIWTNGDWNDIYKEQTVQLLNGQISREDL